MEKIININLRHFKIRGHHKPSFANKFENLELIVKFLEKYKLARLTEDEKEKSEYPGIY